MGRSGSTVGKMQLRIVNFFVKFSLAAWKMRRPPAKDRTR